MATRETTLKLSVADNFSTQLRAFARALEQGDQQVNKLSASQKLLKSAGQGATDMLMGMGISLPTSPMMVFGQALSFVTNAAMEQEKATFATQAVIKSTGAAAGYTADQIGAMAQKFSDLSGVDDELIQGAENVMLTFTNIGHDTFPQAMQAAQDMSAALGTDLQGAVLQVGKALQDPIGGLTALRRAGVNVNDAMKETVKRMVDMGDTAGAQKYILKELNSEFGGMAEALGDTTQGKINKFNNAIENLGEAIGSKLLPPLGQAADAAVTLIQWQDKLNEAYAATAEAILDQKTNYADYKNSLMETAKAAGLVTTVNGGMGASFTVVSDQVKILTEAEWNAARGLYGVNGALDESNRAARRAAEATELMGKSAEDASTNVSGLTAAQDILSSAAQNLTAELIFQKASQDMDASAALQLGLSMGVLQGATVVTLEKLQELRAKYDSNRDGAIDAAEAARGYSHDVQQLANKIDGLHDKTITIKVNYHEQGSVPEGHTGGGGGYAAGTNFIVPPGYPNDSYPLRVQSGERVTVTPAAQVTNNKNTNIGGATLHITNNITATPGMDVNALADQVSQKITRKLRAMNSLESAGA